MSTTPSDPAQVSPTVLPTGYVQEPPPPLGTARRTNPLTVGIELATLASSLVFELLTRRLGGEPQGGGPWDPGMATLPLLFLGPRVLRWWFRTYTVTETHLEVDEGVLQRRHRVVPYSRVQQVDLRQHLLAQAFGLAALHIETAGEGGATAVSLSLLSKDDAASVRRFVLDRRDGAPGANRAGDEHPTLTYELARMSVGDLLLAAVTQGPGMLSGLLVLLALPWLLAAATGDEPGLAAAAIGVVLALGVFTTAIRAVGLLLTDLGWTMTHRGDDLHLRAGLINVREQSVPRRRVQRVSVVDNPLRRMFGFTSVVLHTAVPAGTEHGVSPLVEVPLLRRHEVDDFLVRVMGPEWTVPDLQPRGPAAARRAVVRRLLVLLPGAVGPGLVFGGVAWATMVVAAGAVPWGRAAHRAAGHAVRRASCTTGSTWCRSTASSPRAPARRRPSAGCSWPRSTSTSPARRGWARSPVPPASSTWMRPPPPSSAVPCRRDARRLPRLVARGCAAGAALELPRPLARALGPARR